MSPIENCGCHSFNLGLNSLASSSSFWFSYLILLWRMGFSEKGVYSEFATNDSFGDTVLRLDCLGYGTKNCSQFVNPRNDSRLFSSVNSDDGCVLVLGLGPSPTIYSGARHVKGSSSSELRRLSCNGVSNLKLGLSVGMGSFFESLEFSTSSRSNLCTNSFISQVCANDPKQSVPIVDEGSTSAKKSSGYVPSLLLARRMETEQSSQLVSEHSNTSYNMSAISEPSTATVTSMDQRTHNTKRCKFMGCTKGARGASGLCISHGGGQRCQKPTCNKGAESRTAYCKAHGGGRRCQHLGCTKSAEGKTDLCIAHGGGRRCGFPGGCTKAARGKSGLCIRHGGGKRCKVEGCTRSAEGYAGLCISHGGGRRCQFPRCTKGAQGSTMFCKAHGGGKQCIFAGCTMGAEGSTPLCKGHGGGKRCMFNGAGICPKSVHGGTNFCVAHGGGKRCVVAGCTKSARGRTDCCVRHGGGKRCKIEGCGKSAQGSTDFCKAHGGGKRCCWDGGKCKKFSRGRNGMCAAHSNMVHERENNAKQAMITPGLFHGLVSGASSLSVTSVVSDCGRSIGKSAVPQHLIPPDVQVPLSMQSTSSYSVLTIADERCNGDSSSAGFDFLVPEGRVHGGV